MDIIIGCDPEVFVRNNRGYIPARVVAPNLGDKDNPTDFGDDTNGQIDGMALEFGITPTADPNVFVRRVQKALQHFDALATNMDASLAIVPVATFDFTQTWQVKPEDLELGCSPDFNAYSGRRNVIPKDVPTGFRTAAGHIHIGWTSNQDPFSPGHLADCRDVIKQLDAMFMGTYLHPHVIMELEIQRRRLYGKAGAFRPKSYGVEYRVPSNNWLKSAEAVYRAHQLTMLAVQDLAAGEFYPENTAHNIRDRVNGLHHHHPLKNVNTPKKYWSASGQAWWRSL
jgi:hypothetical protein